MIDGIENTKQPTRLITQESECMRVFSRDLSLLFEACCAQSWFCSLREADWMEVKGKAGVQRLSRVSYLVGGVRVCRLTTSIIARNHLSIS